VRQRWAISASRGNFGLGGACRGADPEVRNDMAQVFDEGRGRRGGDHDHPVLELKHDRVAHRKMGSRKMGSSKMGSGLDLCPSDAGSTSMRRDKASGSI